MVQITQNTWKWRHPYMCSNEVWLWPSEKVWYCAQTKSYWKHIFWDIKLKFETQLVQSFGFDFLAVLESTRFWKKYILYHIWI